MPITPLAYWVVNFDPYLVRFTENIGIRYYGLAYVMGFLVAAWLLIRYHRKGLSQLPAAKVGDLMTALVLGVALGGRIGYYLLYDAWRSFPDDPFGIFKVWEGGMSFHGGLAGVGLSLVIYSRLEKLDFRHVADLVSVVAPAGLFFGRLANFINGELWGKVSHVPWAMIFPRSVESHGHSFDLLPRHPSQLYEAGLEGLVLFAWLQWRAYRSKALIEQPGRLAGEFLIGYALSRMVCELFREPDAGVSFLLGLQRGTFYSLFILAGGAALVLTARKQSESGR
jgi:phosphatidylglycerol:prolipoprotein diacylglycerol transferase